MTRDQVLDVLRATGVLLEGHFQLTSGQHSDRFLQCSQVLQYPEHAEAICRQMARPYRDAGVETVVGPALGGIILSYEVARALGSRAVFTERSEDGMALRRGFKIRPGERVLVVEDAVSTGGSVKRVLDIVRDCGAEVVGISIMVDRTGGRVDLGVQTTALLTLDVKSYDPAECPLCAQGRPLTRPKDL